MLKLRRSERIHIPLLNRSLSLVGRGVAYLVLVGWAVITLLPLYWLFTGAFKSTGALEAMPPEWFPVNPSLENFEMLFSLTPILRWLVNTLIVASVVTISTLFFGSMAGYALAKKKFPGRDKIFWMLLSTMMIPPQVTLIPLYILVTMKLGWGDTYLGLIVPSLVSSWTIFMLKQAMQTLPSSLMDAARIDACTEWGVYWKVVLPLARPALTVAGIFNFVGHWHSFFWPLLVTSKSSMRLLQVGLASFRFENATSYGPMMAGAVISALPIIVMFFALQRFFLQGLTVGAIKG